MPALPPLYEGKNVKLFTNLDIRYNYRKYNTSTFPLGTFEANELAYTPF